LILVTPSQMREIDRRAIEGLGIPSMVLMENAGLSLVEEVGNRLTGEHLRISILCGPGNNGGDGMVAARHLHDRGHEVMVFLAAPRSAFSGDARVQLRIIGKQGVPVRVISAGTNMERVRKRFEESDLAIDALFGTGLQREIDGLFAECVRAINSCPGLVMAVDIPSGLNGETGIPMGETVTADVTVTLAFPKLGIILFPGADFAGEIVVADIGIPFAAVEGTPLPGELIGPGILRPLFAPRWGDSHKGTYGHLLVCSGSTGKIGAGILAAKAALRTGAGLVTLALPSSAITSVDAAAIEVMTTPLPETEVGSLSTRGVKALEKLIRERDALAIGPGLTVHEETTGLVREILSWPGFPAVVDADALNAIAGGLELLKPRGDLTILTPHPGEMARLMDISLEAVQADRVGTAVECSRNSGCVVVLKGARTIVASPDGKYHVNMTGNPGMASAGTGDVLTGMIGALLARGVDPLNSALASVYLHGLAGDAAADASTEHSMTAGDLLEFIGPTLKDTLKNSFLNGE